MEAKGSVERETAANLTAQKNTYVIKQLRKAGGQTRDGQTKIGSEGDRDRTESRRDRDIEGGSEQMNNCLMSSA